MVLNGLVGGILSHTSRSSWIMTSNRRLSDIQELYESGTDEDGSSARIFILVVVGIMCQRTISELKLIVVTLGKWGGRLNMGGNACMCVFLYFWKNILRVFQAWKVRGDTM